MATKPNTQTESNPFAKLFAEADTKLRTALANVASAIAIKRTVEDEVSDLVVEMRKQITREVTSKSTKKAVTVPSWDGRGAAYREWYNDHCLVIIEEMVTDADLARSIRSNVQNLVQAKVKKAATKSQLAHLGLSFTKKGTDKPKGNDGTSNDGNDGNDTDIHSLVDVPIVAEAKSLDITAGQMVEMARHFVARVNNRVASGTISKGEYDRTMAQSKTALDQIISGRANLQASRKAAPAAKATATKVAA